MLYIDALINGAKCAAAAVAVAKNKLKDAKCSHGANKLKRVSELQAAVLD